MNWGRAGGLSTRTQNLRNSFEEKNGFLFRERKFDFVANNIFFFFPILKIGGGGKSCFGATTFDQVGENRVLINSYDSITLVS